MPGSRVQQPQAPAEGAHLILYDGVCGLCSRLNQFVIARDDQRLFHFASLQSAAGKAALAPFGSTSSDLTTFYVLANYQSAAPVQLAKSRAALFVMTTLGWPWRAAGLFHLLPKRLADRAYDVVAHNRYRIFGRHEACLLDDVRRLERWSAQDR